MEAGEVAAGAKGLRVDHRAGFSKPCWFLACFEVPRPLLLRRPGMLRCGFVHENNESSQMLQRSTQVGVSRELGRTKLI